MMSGIINDLVQQNSLILMNLQEKLGYKFKDNHLLQKALIHSSFAFEKGELGNDNEKLEFLGDAVLDLAIGHILFTVFPEMKEGELTRFRSALVNERCLAEMAISIELGEYLFLGKGEESSRGREKPSILARAYEAVVGAIFLDGEYNNAIDFVREKFAPLIDNQKELMLLGDAKSLLQEKIQAEHGAAPEYIIDEVKGPSHDREFSVSVRFRGMLLGAGKAGSKKEAEQQAASKALTQLKND